ncbi:hypothetical protein BJ165DRAFT_1405969 [Panaeolus papilionaceus]|nr:hypothetical protein BJ165DRAFT_1405969 [Panaeolus papilionaceus]
MVERCLLQGRLDRGWRVVRTSARGIGLGKPTLVVGEKPSYALVQYEVGETTVFGYSPKFEYYCGSTWTDLNDPSSCDLKRGGWAQSGLTITHSTCGTLIHIRVEGPDCLMLIPIQSSELVGYKRTPICYDCSALKDRTGQLSCSDIIKKGHSGDPLEIPNRNNRPGFPVA